MKHKKFSWNLKLLILLNLFLFFILLFGCVSIGENGDSSNNPEGKINVLTQGYFISEEYLKSKGFTNKPKHQTTATLALLNNAPPLYTTSLKDPYLYISIDIYPNTDYANGIWEMFVSQAEVQAKTATTPMSIEYVSSKTNYLWTNNSGQIPEVRSELNAIKDKYKVRIECSEEHTCNPRSRIIEMMDGIFEELTD